MAKRRNADKVVETPQPTEKPTTKESLREGRVYFKGSSQFFYITSDELLHAYALGERDFSRCVMNGQTLEHKSLTDCDFTMARFTNCRMYQIDFNGCKFDAVLIKYSDLDGCDIAGVSFVGSQIAYTSMRSASAAKASFRESTFAYVNFCNMAGYKTNFEGAQILLSELDSGYFVEANFHKAEFRRSSLINTIFQNANLTNADLLNCTFMNSDFSGANIIDAMGIYSIYSPHLSSRSDILYAGITVIKGKLKLVFRAGCQHQLTAKELLEAVEDTHGDSIHGSEYKNAIDNIQKMFKLEVKAGKWDYLIELDPHEVVED